MKHVRDEFSKNLMLSEGFEVGMRLKEGERRLEYLVHRAEGGMEGVEKIEGEDGMSERWPWERRAVGEGEDTFFTPPKR